jgi:hypothetical protein
MDWINEGILNPNDVLLFRPRFYRGPEIDGKQYPMQIQFCFKVIS